MKNKDLTFMNKMLISELETHIEHPTKPGYRRHDILDRIKELKSSKINFAKRININEEVLVRLTDKGMSIFKNDFESMAIHEFTFEDKLKLYMNADRYIRFQIWELMSIFGSHLYDGCDQLFEENSVIINTDILK